MAKIIQEIDENYIGIGSKGKKDLLDHIILIQELEEALHRKVDVLTYKYIHPALREQILADQVRIL